MSSESMGLDDLADKLDLLPSKPSYVLKEPEIIRFP
jgi:hypothetical protein